MAKAHTMCINLPLSGATDIMHDSSAGARGARCGVAEEHKASTACNKGAMLCGCARR